MNPMPFARRIVCLAMGGIAGLVFCPFVLAVVLALIGLPTFTDEQTAIGNIVGAIGGGALGYFLSGKSIAARWSLAGALIVGSITFLAGFIGPMILTPGANQGPLLGIFFTGPLGFVVGAVIGMVIGLIRESRQVADPFSAAR